MPGDLISLLDGFSGAQVLLVGDLILDRYLYGDAERISPEAPVPVLRVVNRTEALGGSANVAACLRALGCEVDCCGVVGRDQAGERVVEMLAALGVRTEGIVRSAERPTTTKTRLVGLAQHRHRQQLMRLDEEIVAPLTSAEMATVKHFIQGAVGRAGAICIEDYDKGVVSAPLVAEIARAASPGRTPILVDPARLSDYARYRGATLLTPNRTELALAAGQEEFAGIAAAAEAGERVRAGVGAQALVITLDKDGAVVVEQGRDWTHVPTRPRSVYDNTGAGDAVLAMLAAAIASKAPLIDAVKLANVAGGLEVEKFGCVPITREEVRADLVLADRRHQGKLRSVKELVSELRLRHDRGESIVFTNGCYDILHAGHVDFLRRARELGAALVVGLNSDASVRSLDKGPGRPIHRQEDRAAVLGALEAVDYVVLFEEPDPLKLIEAVRPDVLVKGADWSDKGVVGGDYVRSYGGRVELLPLIEGHSTTSIIGKIRKEGQS